MAKAYLLVYFQLDENLGRPVFEKLTFSENPATETRISSRQMVGELFSAYGADFELAQKNMRAGMEMNPNFRLLLPLIT